ncbi:MAG: hypothetical protein ACRD4B_01005 [Acidobacteriota bacterium]
MKTLRDAAHVKHLAILFLALIALWSIVSTVIAAHPPANPTEDAGCAKCRVLKEKETDVERVTVFERNDAVIAMIEPKIESKEDLLAYKANAMSRLALGSSSSTRFAAVTFTSLLTIKEMEDLLKDTVILRLRYVSRPFGGGEMSYPSPPENIERLERSIRAGGRTPSSFQLVDGYVAADIQGTLSNLRALQHDERSFLVDVGPVEALLDHQEGKIFVRDVYYRYNKYSD